MIIKNRENCLQILIVVMIVNKKNFSLNKIITISCLWQSVSVYYNSVDIFYKCSNA
jgi:hypothetical protein